MRLTYESITRDLDLVFDRMVADGFEAGIVGHLNKTESIGAHFADCFRCDYVELPSLRKGRNARLARTLNSIYPYLPEIVLKNIAERYKRIYSSSERTFPDFDTREVFAGDTSPVLIVDDNAYTGKSLEMWKREIQEKSGRDVKTFSITVTGDYKPDYFCYKGWHSFEWRPIGL